MAKQKAKGKVKAKWKSKANADRIFAAMREGKSLRQTCRVNDWPLTTVYDWLAKELAEQYANAQAARADYFFDDILEIADSTPDDKEAVAAARLKIDTRKWIMGRMCPKKYAENVKVDLSGEAKVTHDGNIDITPSDMAVRRINEIIGQTIGQRQAGCVEDTGQE